MSAWCFVYSQVEKLKEQEHNKEMWTIVGDNPDFPKRIQELQKKADDPLDVCDSSCHLEPDSKKSKLDLDTKNDVNPMNTCTSDRNCDNPSGGSARGIQWLTMDGKPQPPFQWEKWFPSESCPQCRKQYLDPKPNQLKLYLHALSYKVSSLSHVPVLEFAEYFDHHLL